jgi:bifunctional UDP-N-acetylglucosamine pyrophosphorylase/glucosamine-1-phosphate N-acetyltransferase
MGVITINLKAIILAAGKGVRMKSELPKVLHPLLEKPLIQHVIDNLKASGTEDITVVIGYKGEQVEAILDKDVHTVWQHEQLGTGHAVLQAKEHLQDFSGRVVVACGDAPLISADSFAKLIAETEKPDVKASVMTMIHEDPSGYGRMVKDEQENLLRIVEEKDASEEEKTIKEVNTGTYVFDAEFLFDGLNQINNNNAQGEYYLPDVIEYIVNLGHKVTTMPLENAFEGHGINSKEELEKLEQYILSNK